MTTYYSESFFRGEIAESISSTAPAGTLVKVTKQPSIANGLLTISPNTENEEIIEYTNFSTGYIILGRRGIKPSATSLLNAGVDYNNPTYMKSHAIGDLIRGDVNNIHLNQIIDITAGITPNSIYDAVVASSGGTHTTIASALAASKRNILVKGTITENTNQDLQLTGDTNITFNSGSVVNLNLINKYAFTGAYKLNVTGGTINITGTTSVGLCSTNETSFTNTTVNISSTASITFIIANQNSTSSTRSFYNCYINTSGSTGTATTYLNGAGNNKANFLNCEINLLAVNTEGTSGSNATYTNCIINANNGTSSRIYNSGSKFTSCNISYGKEFTFSSTSSLINCNLSRTGNFGGLTHVIDGEFIGGSLSDTEVVNNISVTGIMKGVIINGLHRITTSGITEGNKWISSAYTGAASVIVSAKGIFNGNYVNTKSTSAGTATVTGIFTSNIAEDDVGTFTTSGAGVIANNQLS